MIDDRWPLVELLLCAADLARQGYIAVLTEASERFGSAGALQLALEASRLVRDLAPRAFDYRGDLLADTLLECAYRYAERP